MGNDGKDLKAVRDIARKTAAMPSRRKLQHYFAFLISPFLIAPAAAQTTAAPETPSVKQESATTTSANVDEVSFDLMAYDKSHKPIRDLKPEDVVVMDNGTTVHLKDLHLVSAASNADHLVTFVSDRFAGSLGRNVQIVAAKILKSLPSKGYSFAVLDFAGRLRLINGFTDDRNEVRDALRVVTETSKSDKAPVIELAASNKVFQKALPENDDQSTVVSKKAEKNLIAIAHTGVDLAGTRVDAANRARYQTLLTALQSSRQIQQDQHSLPTLSGLLALVRSQQKLAVRKCIVYFTLNQQMDSAAKEMIKSITEAANQAGVILYVVDMDALDVGGQHQIDNALGAQNVAFNPGPVAVPGSGGMATQIPSQQMSPSGPSGNVGVAVDWLRQSDKNPFGQVKSPLADMARNTGGAYIDAQDSVKKPLQQMLEDMTTYYQASYIPPIDGYDGSFRTIAFKPVRSNVTIKAKTGYFAVRPDAEGGIRPFEAPVLKLLMAAESATDIKFRVSVLHFGELNDVNTNTAAFEIPIDQLQTKIDEHTNLFSAHVSVVAQIKDKSGTVIEHFAEDVSHRAAAEALDRDKAATINIDRHFPATPGQYTLEVAVLDRLSDKGGVQRIHFEIPAEEKSPSLSDVVMVRKVDGFRGEDDPDEPMYFEKGKITPNIAGDVPQDAKAVSLFFIIHPDVKSKEPVKVEIVASRNGNAGKRMALPLHIDSTQDSVPYLASFNSGLPPGDYDMKAVITQGEKTSTKDLAFTVAGEQIAANSGGNAIAGLHSAGPADDPFASGPDAPKTQLSITAVTNPVPPPAPEDIKQLIADSRDRSLHYMESLPNFMCIEVTNRSIDSTGSGRWKLRDNISELLRYKDKTETRTMLEVNGKTDSTDREAMKGTFSSGELGGVLRAVFADKANADFQWRETDALGTGTVQVFDYHVDQKNSEFAVVGMNNKEVMVGFHGQVFIDPVAHNVRRITLIADDMPKDFPTHYTSIAVDYDYVLINTHDYLMPISAQLRLQQGRHEAVQNSIEFRNYRRFGSSMRIVDTGAEPQQQ
jgi:VWFA-related protein